MSIKIINTSIGLDKDEDSEKLILLCATKCGYSSTEEEEMARHMHQHDLSTVELVQQDLNLCRGLLEDRHTKSIG